MKNKITLLASCLLIGLLAGCTTDPNKHTARVIGGAGKVVKGGIGENPVTGLYELTVQDGDEAAMVVPIMPAR